MTSQDDRLPTSAPANAEDLYELLPAEFVGARNALVRQLRAAGERDQATKVGKLRRPPATAWALNQLARHQPEMVGRVLAAGAALRAAMDAAVAGDSSAVRVAQADDRAAVSDALTAAGQVLRAQGQPMTDAAARRMAETLRAAVLDPAVADRLRAGALDADQEALGFGIEGGDTDPSTEAPEANVATEVKAVERAGQPDAMERERRRRAQAERAERQAEAQRLSDRAQRLGARADEAEEHAAEARAQAERAEAVARSAWEGLGDSEP